MTELEALRRVAEAARKWRIAYAREEEGWDYCEDAVDERLDLEEAVLALDALPAPAAEPEVVEVAVWRDNDDGEVVFCTPKTKQDDPLHGWTRLGTTRLALVPEVVGEVVEEVADRQRCPRCQELRDPERPDGCEDHDCPEATEQ